MVWQFANVIQEPPAMLLPCYQGYTSLWIWTRTYRVLIVVMLFQHLHSDGALKSCMSGTYMTRHGSGMDICDICKDGTFMPDVDHTNRQCNSCKQVIDDSVEVITQPCNISHDAVIQCVPGFYRRRTKNPRAKDACVPCSRCDKPTVECSNYTDAVCCLPNYEAVLGIDDIYRCEERPCGYGQRFDEKTDQCVPCPEGTYMPQDVHKSVQCLKCVHLQRSSTYNSQVFNNCTDRYPTIFGCKKGYYRNLSGEPLIVEANCSSCSPCYCKTSSSCFHFGDNVCEPCGDTSTPPFPEMTTGTDNRSTSSTPGCVTPPYEEESSPNCSIHILLTFGATLVIIIIIGIVIKYLRKSIQKKRLRRLATGEQ